MNQAFYDGLRENITTYGQSVLGVGAGHCHCDGPDHSHGEEYNVLTKGLAFYYTIGNAEVGLPELLLVGDYVPSQAAGILNDLGERQRLRGEQFLDGEIVKLDPDAPFGLLIHTPKDQQLIREHLTVQVGQALGTESYQVLQVLAPDTIGRYAHDPLCMQPQGMVPVF